jgi:hypothetical protein
MISCTPSADNRQPITGIPCSILKIAKFILWGNTLLSCPKIPYSPRPAFHDPPGGKGKAGVRPYRSTWGLSEGRFSGNSDAGRCAWVIKFKTFFWIVSFARL